MSDCYICGKAIDTSKDYFTYMRNQIPFYLHEECIGQWRKPKHNAVEIKEDSLAIEENFS